MIDEKTSNEGKKCCLLEYCALSNMKTHWKWLVIKLAILLVWIGIGAALWGHEREGREFNTRNMGRGWSMMQRNYWDYSNKEGNRSERFGNKNAEYNRASNNQSDTFEGDKSDTIKNKKSEVVEEKKWPASSGENASGVAK